MLFNHIFCLDYSNRHPTAFLLLCQNMNILLKLQQDLSILRMGAREETIRISIFFFLMFTPFSSYMTILTHIYETAHLSSIGPATLACNYVAFIISTFVAPAIRLPLKVQLMIGAFAYTLNYSFGIFVQKFDQPAYKYLISCFGSTIAGLSGGLLWVSQGRYIHLVCEKYGVVSRKGEMYGLFSSLYCLSNISAGLITTFGLGFFDAQTYFFIITALGIISILFCLFFVRPIHQIGLNHMHHSPMPNQIRIDSNHQPLLQPKTIVPYNIKQSLLKVVYFFPAMFSVLPILIIDGISLGIYSSEITHLIPSSVPKDLLDKYAGYSMISLGTGSTIGGYLCGKFADKFGTIISGRIGIALFLLGCGLFITAVHFQSFVITLIAAFEWGLFLFYIQGWMYLVCSRHFGGKSQAFSVNKQLHSVFYLVFQLIVIYTGNDIPLTSLVGWLMLFAVPAILLINKIPNQLPNSQ